MSLTPGVVGVGLFMLILFSIIVALGVYFNKNSEKKYDPLTSIDKTFTKDELDQVVLNSLFN